MLLFFAFLVPCGLLSALQATCAFAPQAMTHLAIDPLSFLWHWSPCCNGRCSPGKSHGSHQLVGRLPILASEMLHGTVQYGGLKPSLQSTSIDFEPNSDGQVFPQPIDYWNVRGFHPLIMPSPTQSISKMKTLVAYRSFLESSSFFIILHLSQIISDYLRLSQIISDYLRALSSGPRRMAQRALHARSGWQDFKAATASAHLGSLHLCVWIEDKMETKKGNQKIQRNTVQ